MVVNKKDENNNSALITHCALAGTVRIRQGSLCLEASLELSST